MRRLMRNKKVRAGLAVAAPLIGLAAAGGAYALAKKESPLAPLSRGADKAGEKALAASADTGLAVADVIVTGRARTSVEHLFAALDVTQGDPILGLDIDRAKRRIEALPWVRTATVERRLPDTISVAIEERRPAALWLRDGVHALIDRDGAHIPVDIAPFTDLPVVVGAGANDHVGALLDMVAGHPDIAARLRGAAWVSGRRWNLHLQGDGATPEGTPPEVVVRLPDDDADAALSRLTTLAAEHALLARDLEMIDLRYADRLIVRVAGAGEDEESQRPAAKARGAKTPRKGGHERDA